MTEPKVQITFYRDQTSYMGKEMATHSSTLAWRIPWTEEPGRLHTVHGVVKSWTRLSDFSFTFHSHALEKEMATHSSVLAWRIPGRGEPGGLLSVGSHRVRHDWSDLAAAANFLQCTLTVSLHLVHTHTHTCTCTHTRSPKHPQK